LKEQQAMNAIALVPLLLALGQAEAKPADAAPAAVAAPVAAPAAAPSVQLTLDEALARAVEVNNDLKAARARFEAARQGIWKAWSYYLPQVTASGAWTRNPEEIALPIPVAYNVHVDTTTGDGSTTTPLATLDATLQPKTQLAGQVQVTQALVAPALFGMIQAAAHGATAAAAGAETAQREILFGVSALYYNAATVKRTVEVTQQLFEDAKKHERDAEVRYRAGTIPKIGLLRSQMERAKAEQDLLRVRNGYQALRLAIATALDREADFDVVEPPEPVLPSDLGALEEKANRDRPDLKAAREAEAAARSARWGTAGKYLPSLAAFGRYVYADPPGLTGTKDTWAVGLAANWNVFDGGLREAELREANAKVAEAEAARKSAEARARTEVRTLTLEYQSATANAVKAKEQRDLARENQKLVDVSYGAGAATALEQADAQTQLRGAEVQFLAETFNARLAALRLLKAAGEFDPSKR
jgi:outer membrane protein TolC